MAEETDAVAGLRTFWSGTITFGLVSVPVALFPATHARGVALRMVDGDGAPVQRRYVCSKDGKELGWDDIVRGYEVEKGKFVLIEDEELEAIEPRKSRDIDLRVFVPLEEIDPKYFERAYFLVPGGTSNKAYRLLAHVMERSGRAGVATFVMRAKEYVVAIIAENGILRAETLRFADELRTPADVGLPKKQKPPAATVTAFERAMARRGGKLDLHDFTDRYAERLEKLVHEKQRRHKDVVRAPAEEAESAQPEEGNVVDLIAALRRSLGGRAGVSPAGPAPSRRRKPAAAKRKPAKRSASRRR